MAKYLRWFNNHSGYEDYINGDDAIFPNVSWCDIEEDTHINKGYDSQISFLESTGTQYINLDYIPKGSDVVEVRCCSTVITGFSYYDTYYVLFNPIFGVQNSASHNYWAPYVRDNRSSSSQKWYRYYYYNTHNNGNVYNYFGGNRSAADFTTMYTFIYNGNTLTRDGVELTPYTTNNAASPSLQYSMHLFAVNTEGNASITRTGTSMLKIAYFKLKTSTGILIRDCIPVRIGTIGYMYDRVSGKLFGNDGTGEFELGDDI